MWPKYVRSFLLVWFVLLTKSAFGQPATDIFLADLRTENGMMQISTPVNATDRNGYDNQPCFLPDGSGLLYTSIHEDGQADIYIYDLRNRTIKQIIKTTESEYSPTVMFDGKHFSTVRVEADSTQRLWKFPLDGGGPSLLLEKIKPLGYHAWGTPNIVALFVLGQPPSLYLANARTPATEGDKIIAGIGRSLHKIPKQNAISFVHKVAENEWWIKRLDLESRNITPLIQTLAGSEDYAWTPDGTILMGQNSKLFKWKLESDEDWVEIADFEQQGLAGITRIAVSPMGDKVALVGSRSKEE